MKKLFIISLFCAQLKLFPQPVINFLLPVNGEKYNVAWCNYIPPGSAGSNQTWDFSQAGVQWVDTLVANSYSTIGCGFVTGNFSMSISVKSNTFQTPFEFFTDRICLGTSNNYGPYVIAQSEFLNYPITYNSGGNINACGYNQSGTCIADGYGTLILPSGTFNNILRVKLSLNAIGFDKNIRYFWFHPYSAHPLASITDYSYTNPGDPNYPPTASVTAFQYLKNIPVGIEEKESIALKISAYPNPVNNDLYISISGNEGQIVVADLFGITLLKYPVTEGRVKLNTEKIPNGFYILTFLSEKGDVVSKPLVIKH
jgi:hypothetical protein